MARATKSGDSKTNRSALGFEATLWATADKLRGNLDAAEYKHVVLGLIFLKYISDAFEEKHAALQNEKGANPEDRDFSLSASNGERVGVRCRIQTARANGNGNGGKANGNHANYEFRSANVELTLNE